MVSNDSFNEREVESRLQRELLQQGSPHVQESEEETEKRLNYEMDLEKAEGPGQGLLATFEGAGEGFAGPAFTALEEGAYKLTGAEILSPEMRRAREEKHGGKKTAAEITAFTGSLLTGVGEARVLEKIGEAGIKYFPKAAKVLGSNHLRAIIETGTMSAGHQATKWLNEDPNLTVGTALTDVGLSGALGGGISVVMSKFMKSTMGKKISQNLKAVSDHYGGVEGAGTDSIDQIESNSGIILDPELRGALKTPQGKEILNKLNQTDTSAAGIKAQKKFSGFKDAAADALTTNLGSTIESIPKQYDKYSEGNIIAKNASKESKDILDPLVKEFEAIKEESKEIPLVPDRFEKIQTEETKANPYLEPKYTQKKIPGVISEATDNLYALARQEGWTASPSSRIMKEVNRIVSELPLQKNVKDLTNLIKSVSDKWERNPTDGSWNRYIMQIVSTLREMEGFALELHAFEKLPKNTQTKLYSKASEKFQRLKDARKGYAEAGKLLDPLMERVGLEGSLSGFPERLLKEAKEDGEGILRKLSGKNDAALLEQVSTHFPETARAIRQAHVRQILSDAMIDGRLIPERIMKSLNDLSPQLRKFITAENTTEIDAIGKLLELFKNPKHNFSNTARTIGYQLKLLPATAGALATGLLGHGLLPSAVVGLLSHMLFVESGDAARLIMLKWMGTAKNTEPAAIRAIGQFYSRTLRGENFIRKSAKDLFESTGKIGLQEVLDEYHKEDRIDLLDKRLKEFETNPDKFTEISSSVGYYLPRESMAITSTLSNAVGYLSMKRPRPVKTDSMSPEIEPSQAQINAFRETLKIAEQPLSLFQEIKQGTLTTEQVQDLQNMYPGTYQAMANTLQEELTDHVAKGGKVPYQMKMAISTFLGTPLDSDFEPQNVVSNQQTYAQSNIANQQQQMSGSRPSKSGMQKFKRDKRVSLELSDTA